MEWCFDAWYDYPKGEKEVTVDPFKIGQPNKDTFVVRGGAWWSVLACVPATGAARTTSTRMDFAASASSWDPR